MSAATTLNCTAAAALQQQELLLPAAPQAAALVLVMLCGMTLKAEGAKPRASDAHVANASDEVLSALTLHSSSSALTSSQG